jgi:hypothetical protein
MPVVTVTQPSVIQVQVNNQRPTVQSINYGSKTIKGSADLRFTGAQNGDVIAYDSANNDFVVTNIAAAVTDIDAGTF